MVGLQNCCLVFRGNSIAKIFAAAIFDNSSSQISAYFCSGFYIICKNIENMNKYEVPRRTLICYSSIWSSLGAWICLAGLSCLVNLFILNMLQNGSYSAAFFLFQVVSDCLWLFQQHVFQFITVPNSMILLIYIYFFFNSSGWFH